jgi:hypothetical protein
MNAGMTSDLLSDIEDFLEAHGMAATTFSQEALRDRHFVRQLRQGRRVWPDTEQRVRKFMAEYVAPPAARPPFPASKNSTSARVERVA